MKEFREYLTMKLNESCSGCKGCEEEETGGKISSEKDFREYAENKFKEVFGDKLDEDKMNKIIEDIIKKHSDDWGTAVGVLNKSFGK